jgi:glycosyltransferase involved in cell wall biosynthesis
VKILARVHLFPPDHCAGAERMLEEMLVSLVDRGHNVEVYLAKRSPSSTPYEYRGIKVFPRSVEWYGAALEADVLVTHLDQTSEVVGVAAVLDKPIVQILHNTHAPTRMWATCKADLLVYNSEWMANELGHDPRAIVVRPPVYAADYGYFRSTSARQALNTVTLVNTNEAKGGIVFAMLAALMPSVNFLGVAGAYGEQVDPGLTNTLIVEHGVDMDHIYANTSIVIMPSSYESWGRVGVEAMSSGIPVIAHPTLGLKESLGDAGIFVDRNDIYEWARTIKRLLTDAEAYEKASDLAVDRSLDLDPTDDLARWVKAVETL